MLEVTHVQSIHRFFVKIASWVIGTSYILSEILIKITVNIYFLLSDMCDHKKLESLG